MVRTLRHDGGTRLVGAELMGLLTLVSAITWRTIFEPSLGLAPQMLSTLGLPGDDVVWPGEEGYSPAVMVLADVWKTAPFMALLLLAGLQVIPDGVYDAAKVGGAGARQRFRRITLPLLGPATLVALAAAGDLNPHLVLQGAGGGGARRWGAHSRRSARSFCRSQTARHARDRLPEADRGRHDRRRSQRLTL